MPPQLIHDTACGYGATSANDPAPGSNAIVLFDVAHGPFTQPPTRYTVPSATATPAAARGCGLVAASVLHEPAAGS